VIRQFELNESSSEDGMICGGTAEILLEQIGVEELSLFSRLKVLRDKGNDCTLLRHTDATKQVVRRTMLEEITDDVIERLPWMAFSKRTKSMSIDSSRVSSVHIVKSQWNVFRT